MSGALRILYVGDLSPVATSTHRFLAFKRLGHQVEGIDSQTVARTGNRITSGLQIRLAAGPSIVRLNREVLERAKTFAPQLVWFDKPQFIWPSTLRRLRAGGALLVQYNCDNPFGTRRDPGWRLYRKTIADFDLVLVPRESGIATYGARGAKDVRLMTFAYEPTIHFPPPTGWDDANRPVEVSFIGSPYRGRPEFLLCLAREHGIGVHVRGSRRMWERVLSPADAKTLHLDDAIYNDGYRESIWGARISLAFVTHDNLDEVSHRSFEIAACEGFMLAERTPRIAQYFRPGEELALFSDAAECAALIRRYLPDESLRSRMAAAARTRAELSGYSNDARLGEVITYLRERYPALKR